jgi:hypothetical protein
MILLGKKQHHFLLGVLVWLSELCIGIQEATRHTDTNVTPCIVGNHTIEQCVSQECDGDFVHRPDNGICGRTSSLDTAQTGIIQKESNKTGKDVFEEIIRGVDCFGIQEGNDLTLHVGGG